MKSILPRIVCLALTFIVCVVHSPADDAATKSDAAGAKIAETPAFKAFIGDYIAARNSKDRVKIKALFDPVSQALMDKVFATIPNFRKCFDDLMCSDTIPEEHEITVTSVGPDALGSYAKMGVTLAVTPTFGVLLSYETGTHKKNYEGFPVAMSGDKWREVFFFTQPKAGASQTLPASAISVTDAQKQAVTKYPDLGHDGTPLNKTFRELYSQAKASNPAYLTNPNWPLLLADKASSLLAAESFSAAPSPSVTPLVGQKISKDHPDSP